MLDPVGSKTPAGLVENLLHKWYSPTQVLWSSAKTCIYQMVLPINVQFPCMIQYSSTCWLLNPLWWNSHHKLNPWFSPEKKWMVGRSCASRPRFAGIFGVFPAGNPLLVEFVYRKSWMTIFVPKAMVLGIPHSKQPQQKSYGGFLKYGYPCSSSIYR